MSTVGTTTTRKQVVPVLWYRHPKLSDWGWRQVEKTKNGVAAFKPGTPYTAEQFAEFYTEATPIPLNANPDEVAKFWKKFDFIVGASEGEETEYILIKRGCCQVHARPITPGELRSKSYKVKI